MPRRGDGFVDSRSKKAKGKKDEKKSQGGGWWSCCSSGEVAPKETISSEERKRKKDKKEKEKKEKKNSETTTNATVTTEEPSDTRSESPTKVMNLSDLPPGAKFPSPGVDDEEGGFTARTGASFRSARGPRRNPYDDDGESVAGQSEFGMKSVASTSVKQYANIMSGPKKSSKEMKGLVKEFVKEMVKGKSLHVIRADGQLKEVLCGISRSLDTFKIKCGKQLRRIEMKTILRCLVGDCHDELDDLETPLDEVCSTLELESGECISFKFPDKTKAEQFTICLSMFSDNLKR